MNQTSNLKISGEMTGKNKGKTTKWYKPSELNNLVAKADPGDLLEVDRLPYKHWGVYAGRKQSANTQQEAYIVHFDNPDPGDGVSENLAARLAFKKANAVIMLKRLVEVVGQSRVRINNDRDNPVWLKPAKHTDRMNRRIEKFTKEHKSYNVANWNCEHFSTYCRYGVKISDQSRLIWVIISIFCLDAFIGGSKAPSVVILRRLASTYGPPVVAFLFAFLLVSFFIVLKYVISVFGRKRENYMLGVLVVAFMFGQSAWTYVIELGDGASILGMIIGISTIGLGYAINCIGQAHGVSEDRLKDVGCVLGLCYLAYVLGMAFTASLVGMIYVYDTVRLKHVAFNNMLTYLQQMFALFRYADAIHMFKYRVFVFGIVMLYLGHVLGLLFPFFLVIVVYIDDQIRLMFAAYKERLNYFAAFVALCYMLYVFDWRYVAIIPLPFAMLYLVAVHICTITDYVGRVINAIRPSKRLTQ